jgi:hypothetical protein
MSVVFGELFEKIVSRDINLAKPAVEKAIELRNSELELNGYTDLYYDYDGLVEDYNNIFGEDLF